MRTMLIIALLSFCQITARAAGDSTVTDTNSVFFEGAEYSYVLKPPTGMHSLVQSAMREGYSVAFVPDGASLDSAEVLIGVNIFRLTDDAPEHFVDRLIDEDTTAMREFFGEPLVLYEVDSLYAGTGHPIRGFFVNDPNRFIANVMLAYFDGGSEVLTFELVIGEDFPRFRAEELFVDALHLFRPLRKATLGEATD